MGMLDDILHSSVPRGDLARPLMMALMALLASGALHKGSAPGTTAPGRPNGGLMAGLGGLLQRFQQSGLGDVINSWIGPGQNQSISPGQLGSTLGRDVLSSLA